MSMERDLLRKAFRQGYDFGRRGMKISQMDWEEEFLPEYNRGYREGCVDREMLPAQLARVDQIDAIATRYGEVKHCDMRDMIFDEVRTDGLRTNEAIAHLVAMRHGFP